MLSNESIFNKSDLKIGLHVIYFKVKDNDGQWSDEVSRNLIVNLSSSTNEQPVADAGGPYLGYVNVSILFNGSGSTDLDGNEDIVSYLWDFGDGMNGTGVTVEHTYNTSGNYTIKLRVRDTKGRSNISSTYAYIQIPGQNGEGDSIITGFELLIVFIAAIFVLFWKKR